MLVGALAGAAMLPSFGWRLAAALLGGLALLGGGWMLVLDHAEREVIRRWLDNRQLGRGAEGKVA